MSHLRFAIVACALLGAIAAHAGAKPHAAKGPQAKAAAAYRDGVAAFDAGDFAKALAAFTESYNLSGETGLLFNLGVCAEQTGDREKAAAFYSLYLEEVPDAPDAAEVKARLDALAQPPAEATAAPAPPAAPPPPATAVQATAEVEPAAPAPAEEGDEDTLDAEAAEGRGNVGPALLTGLGGLVVGTGVVTAILAYKSYGELKSSCSPDCSAGKVDPVRSTAIAADVQLAVGGAAVAAGVLWILVKGHRERATGSAGAEISALPAVAGDGGGVVVEGRF